ncbi:hypothetical protein A0H76_1989 [Hepatospora eriocheir]|uniref:Uncharacterized protein n=1 Tax=Hepatospora eriocheir TaxID=1081669 RepID=A0A1X0QGE3_9MICR|nr:hypothetical protein A0H76_1989 [Hepatospora eriocheir]
MKILPIKMANLKDYEIQNNDKNNITYTNKKSKLIRTENSIDDNKLKIITNKKVEEDSIDVILDNKSIENFEESEEKSSWGIVRSDGTFRTDSLPQTSETVFNPVRSKPRAQIPFTKEEQTYLIGKVEEYGDCWKFILNFGLKEKVFHPERRRIDLKHKIELIRKNASYHRAVLKTWDLISINGEQIFDNENKRYNTLKKFPAIAVKRFVTLTVLDHLNRYIMTVADKCNISVTHSYRVDVIEAKKGKKYVIRKVKNG